MLNHLSAILFSLVLSFSITPNAIGQIIHWEFQDSLLPTDSGSIRGGFDIDIFSNTISNITVQTGASAGGFCFPCNDFAGSTGSYYSELNADGSPGYFSVTFRETFQTGDLIDQDYILWLAGNIIFESTSALNFKTPGTISDLSLDEIGFLRLGEEYGPDDIYVHNGCQYCVTAIGTLTPIPEPKSYAMLLAGLGMIGFVAHRRKLTAI